VVTPSGDVAGLMNPLLLVSVSHTISEESDDVAINSMISPGNNPILVVFIVIMDFVVVIVLLLLLLPEHPAIVASIIKMQIGCDIAEMRFITCLQFEA